MTSCTLKVPGHGLALAMAVAGHLGHAVQQVLVAPNQVPVIGSTPPRFDGNITDYQHADIVRMIIFYNDTFTILVGDPVGTRVDKFRFFLTTL